MDLTGAANVEKRWQEYTEELYTKDLHDPDNHNGVITHLEQDILDCEVKWALGNITMVVLEKTLESPLDFKEIQPVHPKGDQSWVF